MVDKPDQCLHLSTVYSFDHVRQLLLPPRLAVASLCNSPSWRQACPALLPFLLLPISCRKIHRCLCLYRSRGLFSNGGRRHTGVAPQKGRAEPSSPPQVSSTNSSINLSLFGPFLSGEQASRELCLALHTMQAACLFACLPAAPVISLPAEPGLNPLNKTLKIFTNPVKTRLVDLTITLCWLLEAQLSSAPFSSAQLSSARLKSARLNSACRSAMCHNLNGLTELTAHSCGNMTHECTLYTF